MRIPIPSAWLVPAATAAWAVWTWAHEQSIARDKERERLSALYVNPFMSACEDLQSRIYKLLELDGLTALRARYPDGSYAEETLYLLVRYFGWSVAVNRYGPYTQNKTVIGHASAVRRAFASSSPGHPVGPFNFFLAEQRALGKLMMHHVEGEYGQELDTISYYEFREIVTSTYRMPESAAVNETLAAMREAKTIDDLAGCDRLAAAQRRLVDLLEYLERQEGYRLFPGQRRKCSLPTPGVASITPDIERARGVTGRA